MLQQLNRWFENEHCPNWVPFLLIIMVGLALLGLFYQIDTLSQKQAQAFLRQNEQTLQQRLIEQKALLSQVEQEIAPSEPHEETPPPVLHLMPEDFEMALFLEVLSQQALLAGVEIESFRMMSEQQENFYKAFPVEVSIVGNYHEISFFIKNLSKLSRIVTFHDFNLTPVAAKLLAHYRARSDRLLMMRVVLKTYQYSAP